MHEYELLIETINPCGGEAHANKEFKEIEAESPESGLEAEQLRQTIARTVAAMPPQRRTIFALSRQENLSRQEIARRLGVSVRTVDKHLELALREIRLRIKDFQWVLLLFLFR